jgi:antitoxin YefM
MRPLWLSQKQDKRMMTIYKLNAEELDETFLHNRKSAFAHKQIEIVVSEVDETEYLLRSPANRERLLRAMKDLGEGKNVVVPDQAGFR